MTKREEFIYLSNSPTLITTYGKWIEEPFEDNNKEIVIVVPGNPGFSDFYETFGDHLYTNIKIPVWILSYAGHELLVPSVNNNKNMSQPHSMSYENEKVKLFNLQEQVEHIAEFIRKYVPEDVKVNLIAHSCGSWMTLELLKSYNVKQKIKMCYFLFPTLERLKETMGFYIVSKLIIPYFPFFLNLAKIFHKLVPFFIRLVLFQIALKLLHLPNYMVKPSMKIIHPEILPNIVHLAAEEEIHINQIDLKSLEENKDIIKMLYSDNDPFVPKQFYYQLKEKIPDLNADITYVNHGFMVKYDELIAKHIADCIRRDSVNV